MILKKFLKLLLISLGGIATLIGVFAVWVALSTKARLSKVYSVPPIKFETSLRKANVRLGKRIVRIRNGCVDCHGNDLGGARVIDDPAFARVYGSNITPFKLSTWSNGEIARAIRHGINKNNHPILLMPSHDFQHLSESDLAAVVAYLRQVSPVKKESNGARLGPVGRTLFALGKIPTFLPAEIIDHQKTFPAKPKEEVSVAFGQYLAMNACIGCHNSQLSGGPIPGGNPDWPPASNLTPAGIGDWTESDFIKTMRTGMNPDRIKLQAPMPVKTYAHLSDMELKSLWKYLQTLPPVNDWDP